MTLATVPGASIRLHGYGAPAVPDLKLYCFPHAGGTAPFFRSWPILLPAGIELRAVQLPGRQDLLKAPPFTRMESLVPAVTDAILADAGGVPFAFFGHSLGALTAFETARELRRRGAAGPLAVGLSAARAPQLPKVAIVGDAAGDDELIHRVGELGGIPRELRESPDLLQLALPALRADFALLRDYAYRPEPPLDLPLAVFGGVADHHVSRDALDAWQDQSTRPVAVEQFPGDHFYLTRWSSRIVATLCVRLGR